MKHTLAWILWGVLALSVLHIIPDSILTAWLAERAFGLIAVYSIMTTIAGLTSGETDNKILQAIGSALKLKATPSGMVKK